ncbi:MAG TPA: 50S ribosomal protein L15 [Bacteroidetes bacterium]|nr:50S ribosomal protein L15 [Bacteroidota bacterium]
MELHNLKPAEGATHKRKRIARGQGSGRGGTATRGHKGAKSRSGYKQKRGFEGGQTPLQRRLPKRGFTNPNRKEYVAMNLGRLQEIVDKYNMTEITPESLHAKGIVKKKALIKILGNGELTASVQVTSHAASATAKQAVEEKGGSITIL